MEVGDVGWSREEFVELRDVFCRVGEVDVEEVVNGLGRLKRWKGVGEGRRERYHATLVGLVVQKVVPWMGDGEVRWEVGELVDKILLESDCPTVVFLQLGKALVGKVSEIER